MSRRAEPDPGAFFDSLPMGAVLELRSDNDSAGRAVFTVRRDYARPEPGKPTTESLSDTCKAKP